MLSFFFFFTQPQSSEEKEFLDRRFSCGVQFTSRSKDGLLRKVLVFLTAC